jgi:hypothetical protein
MHLENTFQGGQNKCTGHQPGNIGIKNNEDAPVQFDFIGINVSIHF